MAERAAELAALAQALTSDAGYATGERKFPRPLPVDDAADLAEALHRSAEHWTRMRARAAVEHGVAIACERGCAGCCEELVIVALPEALAVARWLARPENAAAREGFLARYDAWRARAADAPERLAALTVHNRDRDAYVEAHAAYWRRRVPCAFNVDGDCTIYPVRPLVCRDAHAVGTNARCFGDCAGTEPARKIEFGPLVELLRNAHHVLQAAHNALGELNRHEALCVLVHRLLTSASA